jgi:hypothetical protein
MYKSDYKLADQISVSYYAYHNHRDTAVVLIGLVKKALPEFRKLLDIGNVSIRIAPIKGRFDGRFWSTSNWIELDSRLEWDRALETMAHELVHAEQYHTGKMALKKVKGRWLRSWNGEYMKGKASSYEAYRKLPWEIEAYDRQAGLAEAVCSALERE